MKRISGWRVSHCMQEIILLWTWNEGKKSISQTTIHKTIQNTGIHKTQRLSEHLYYTFPPSPPPPFQKNLNKLWHRDKKENIITAHYHTFLIPSYFGFVCCNFFHPLPLHTCQTSFLHACINPIYLLDIQYSPNFIYYIK